MALDEHYDASGAAVAAFDGTNFWYREVANVQAAVNLAKTWTDSEVLVGFSLRHMVTGMGLPHAIPTGAKETNLGLPTFIEAVKAGSIAHEHDELVAEQAQGARVKTSDAGVMSLSIKASAHSVLAIKLGVWLLNHSRNQVHEAACVW